MISGWPFPWKKARSVYDNEGPAERMQFELDGVTFKVYPTGEETAPAGRTKYGILCLGCEEVIHFNTPSPAVWIRTHMKQKHPDAAAAAAVKP